MKSLRASLIYKKNGEYALDTSWFRDNFGSVVVTSVQICGYAISSFNLIHHFRDNSSLSLKHSPFLSLSSYFQLLCKTLSLWKLCFTFSLLWMSWYFQRFTWSQWHFLSRLHCGVRSCRPWSFSVKEVPESFWKREASSIKRYKGWLWIN